MKISLRVKLITSFLAVVILTGLIGTLAGIHLINDRIIKQAQEKVKMDLNSAREIYQANIKEVLSAVRFTAMRKFFIKDALLSGDIKLLKVELDNVRRNESLDILTLTDNNGKVLLRTRNPAVYGDSRVDDELVSIALLEKEAVASTQIISREELEKEGHDLAEQAYMKLLPTPKAKATTKEEETSGMIIKAAAPILDNEGNLIGVLYGGRLLNRKYDIVDKVKDVVFRGEVYKGKDIGTATIFQCDLRISTNVKNNDGSRAIGTRVWEEVQNQVLVNGLPWIGRAFVVNDWYITAYEPIRNIRDEIVGILYVGILERKFIDIKKQTVSLFLGITFTGVIFAFIISYFLARGIVQPVKHLVDASKKIAKGNLEARVSLERNDEIGELANTFNYMAESLKERDIKLKEYTSAQIMQADRLATIGQLAAGVAHEINNPLSGILLYSHLLLESIETNSTEKDKLAKIVREATRCKEIVKGLLDFARQTEPKLELININNVIEEVLSLVGKQPLFINIQILKELNPSLPLTMVDRGQMQQVFTNIIVNAGESMKEQGKLTIKSTLLSDLKFVKISFTDTGCGISKENMGKIFDPFFTTKEAGKGTGLGLAVSYGIVQRHGGNIEVISELGKGATFTVNLPVHTQNSKVDSSPSLRSGSE